MQHITQCLPFSPMFIVFKGLHDLLSRGVGLEAQVSRFDLSAFSQNQATTDTVGQFANIARPGMIAHRDQGALTERARAPASLLAVKAITNQRKGGRRTRDALLQSVECQIER